jgi:hypothetical protein
MQRVRRNAYFSEILSSDSGLGRVLKERRAVREIWGMGCRV